MALIALVVAGLGLFIYKGITPHSEEVPNFTNQIRLQPNNEVQTTFLGQPQTLSLSPQSIIEEALGRPTNTIVWPVSGVPTEVAPGLMMDRVVIENPVNKLVDTDLYETIAKADFDNYSTNTNSSYQQLQEILIEYNVPKSRLFTLSRLAYEWTSMLADRTYDDYVQSELSDEISRIESRVEFSEDARAALSSAAQNAAAQTLSNHHEDRAARMSLVKSQIATLAGTSNEVMFLKLGNIRPKMFAMPLSLPSGQ